MAEKNYPTIQQHQQLRVPKSFDQQGKALINQLEEIFDDIYRRFGRLRLEDMGEKFRNRFEDDEGNITELTVNYGEISGKVETAEGDIAQMKLTEQGLRTDVDNKIAKTQTLQTADEIVSSANSYTNGQLANYSTTSQTADAIALYVGNNAYLVISGISITSSGIELTGNKYIKLKSGTSLEFETGGTISIASGNFELDASGNVKIKGNSEFWGTLKSVSGTFLELSAGNWTFDSTAMKYDDGSTLFEVKRLTDAGSSPSAGIYFDKTSGGVPQTDLGKIVFTLQRKVGSNEYPANLHFEQTVVWPNISGSPYVPVLWSEGGNLCLGKSGYPIGDIITNGDIITDNFLEIHFNNDKTTDSIAYRYESGIPKIVSPSGTAWIGSSTEPFDELHVNTIYCQDLDILDGIYAGGDYIAAANISMLRCTGTASLNGICGHMVAGRFYVISGRYEIGSITPSGNNPGIQITLPSGYKVRSGLSKELAVGSCSYTDAPRNGECTFVRYASNDTTISIYVSQRQSTVTTGKDLFMVIPMTFIPVQSTLVSS